MDPARSVSPMRCRGQSRGHGSLADPRRPTQQQWLPASKNRSDPLEADARPVNRAARSPMSDSDSRIALGQVDPGHFTAGVDIASLDGYPPDFGQLPRTPVTRPPTSLITTLTSETREGRSGSPAKRTGARSAASTTARKSPIA